MIGQQFGRLTVVSAAGYAKKVPLWLCQCSCGNMKVARDGNLKYGGTQSCGCLHKERASAAKRTHGYTVGATSGGKRRPEYRVWVTMIRRCTAPNGDSFRYYGAKGVQVCDRWKSGENGLGGFECFIADMGDRPSSKHSIDRIKTGGNYEPGNCRWATAREQIQTRSIAKWIDWKGEHIPLTVACEREGIPYANVRQRLFQEWTLDRALTTPLRRMPKRKPVRAI